jgi:hypothetical protein
MRAVVYYTLAVLTALFAITLPLTHTFIFDFEAKHRVVELVVLNSLIGFWALFFVGCFVLALVMYLRDKEDFAVAALSMALAFTGVVFHLILLFT